MILINTNLIACESSEDFLYPHKYFDMEKHEIKLSKLYTIADLAAYLYKIQSWQEGLWRYHCIDHNHHYEGCEPEIIEIKNNPDEIEKYTEILYHILCLDTHKRTKYDVTSLVGKVVGHVPDLGIEVAEMSEYYNVGELTSGLFIYYVDPTKQAFMYDFMEGDVLVGIQRPELEKRPVSYWNPQHLDYDADGNDIDRDYSNKNQEMTRVSGTKSNRRYDIDSIRSLMDVFKIIGDGEKLIFEISRKGKMIYIEMEVPLYTKVVMKAYVPKIVIKTMPKMEIRDESFLIRYKDETDPTTKKYLKMRAGVDLNTRDLYLEIPDTVIGVTFYIDEKGNLIADYE